MNIKDFCKILEKEGFTVDFSPASQQIPADRCLVLIELEGKSPDDGMMMEIMFVPQMEKELDGLHLVQYFILLPIDDPKITEKARQTLKEVIFAINFNLPTGAFGYNRQDKFFFYKTMLMLSQKPDTEGIKSIAQTAWLAAYQINMVYPILEMIIKNNLGVEEAFQKINQNFQK
ncbi:MAG: hypothetical protein OHK0057_27620 [Thermoflexibacter sp.]